MDGDDEWEEDQFEEYESILKHCKSSGLRDLPLRWHYRSQHEDLIAYSNDSFYDGRLVTFPGAVARIGRSRGQALPRARRRLPPRDRSRQPREAERRRRPGDALGARQRRTTRTPR